MHPSPLRRAPPLAFAFALGCGLDPAAPGNLVPGTVDDDPSLPALDVPGSRLHLQTFGDPAKPALIFLHGGPGTGDSRSLLRLAERHDDYSLSDDFFLVFYDQRGAGLSRRHGQLSDATAHQAAHLRLADYLADLEAVVEAVSPAAPVYLFGHSWGGMHAAQYVNAHPERVAGLVLSEPGSLSAEIENSLDIELTTVRLHDPAINDFAWSHQLLSPDEHATLDYMYLTGFLNLGGLEAYHMSSDDPLPVYRFGAVASLNDLGADGMREDGVYTFDFSDNLGAFQRPVLFINGDLNEIISADFQTKHNMPLFPEAELVVLEGVGHDLMWTRAADHVALIRQHFTGVAR